MQKNKDKLSKVSELLVNSNNSVISKIHKYIDIIINLQLMLLILIKKVIKKIIQ